MNNNSHAADKKRRNAGRRALLLLVSLVLIAAVAVGGTLAYLHAETEAVTNTFAPGRGGTDIEEALDGNAKTEIIIENTGTVPAYVRVAVIVNTVDEDGNVTGTVPGPIDYNEGNWDYIGGYYYYKGIVGKGLKTTNLLNSQLSFDGQDVDVIAQTVQAAGTFSKNGETVSAPKYAWGVDYVGGSWK